MEEYTRKLADFCSDLDYPIIPEKVVKRIKFCILNNFGIILGATLTDFAKSLAKYTQLLGDGEEATVLGFGFKSSARNAAFVNGSLSDTLELQDGYTKGGNHPCCNAIAASLPIAEWQKKTGRDLITAIVTGYEVGNRISESISPSHLSKGFQATGTAGSIGAAAAAAKLLGLKREQLYNALGIAAFILPVSTGDNLWGGYTIKPIHGGAAAKTGIEAALLAAQGLTAAPLEGDPKIGKGFLRIVSDGPKFEKITQGLGKTYTVSDIYFKPYAICRTIHGPIEMAIHLREKHRIIAEDIQAVLIKTYDFPAHVPGTTRTSTTSPPTLCQFSMPYGVAAALMYGKVGPEQMMGRAIQDPTIHALAGKINVVHDKEMDKLRPVKRPASIEITLKNNQRVSEYIEYPKGEPDNPMTEEELVAQYSDLARDVIGDEKAKKIMDMVFSLEKLDSIEKLIECLK